MTFAADAPGAPRRRRSVAYAIGAVLVLVAYAVVMAVVWSNRGVVHDGPLSFDRAPATEPIGDGLAPRDIAHICYAHLDAGTDVKVVGGTVDGESYYACYTFSVDTGNISGAKVVDDRGGAVDDTTVLQHSGAWPSLGSMSNVGDVVGGGAGLVALLALFFAYYCFAVDTAPLAPRGWFRSLPVLVALAAIPLIGWGVLAALPGISVARKVRMVLLPIIIGGGFLLAGLFVAGSAVDAIGITGVVFLAGTATYGWIAGRQLVAPYGFGVPEDLRAAVTTTNVPVPAMPTPIVWTPAHVGDYRPPGLPPAPPPPSTTAPGGWSPPVATAPTAPLPESGPASPTPWSQVSPATDEPTVAASDPLPASPASPAWPAAPIFSAARHGSEMKVFDSIDAAQRFVERMESVDADLYDALGRRVVVSAIRTPQWNGVEATARLRLADGVPYRDVLAGRIKQYASTRGATVTAQSSDWHAFIAEAAALIGDMRR